MKVKGSTVHKNHNPTLYNYLPFTNLPEWSLVLAISWKVQKRLTFNLVHT